jgi:hypothetical protein
MTTLTFSGDDNLPRAEDLERLVDLIGKPEDETCLKDGLALKLHFNNLKGTLAKSVKTLIVVAHCVKKCDRSFCPLIEDSKPYVSVSSKFETDQCK